MNLQKSLVGFGILLFASISMGWAADHVVTANPDLTFTPNQLTINAGDTVTFKNAGGFHNAVVENGSGTFRCAMGCDGDGNGGNGAPSGANWSATVAFNTAGTFGYHCEIHVSDGMVGTVTVNAVAPPPAAPITSASSGSWYDPDESGHGFLIQVAPPNIFIAYWFVYTPDGTAQAWMAGSGTYDTTSNSATIELAQRIGSKFPPNFNSSDLTLIDWGSLTFTQTDCTHATVSWVSKLPAYGSSSQPLQLTKIIGVNGLTCTN